MGAGQSISVEIEVAEQCRTQSSADLFEELDVIRYLGGVDQAAMRIMQFQGYSGGRAIQNEKRLYRVNCLCGFARLANKRRMARPVKSPLQLYCEGTENG